MTSLVLGPEPGRVSHAAKAPPTNSTANAEATYRVGDRCGKVAAWTTREDITI